MDVSYTVASKLRFFGVPLSRESTDLFASRNSPAMERNSEPPETEDVVDDPETPADGDCDEQRSKSGDDDSRHSSSGGHEPPLLHAVGEAYAVKRSFWTARACRSGPLRWIHGLAGGILQPR